MNSTRQKASRRIVSKGDYVANVSKKTTLSLYGIGLYALGIVLLMAVSEVTWRLAGIVVSKHVIPKDLRMLAFAVPVLGGGALLLTRYGFRAMREGQAIEPVVPFTHANAADLTAPESLVRASEPPAPNQQAELLRAATQGGQTPAEQLLRPAE